ncbi:MAG TPA: lipoate--protein ligase family protein [Lacipirellula sp.]
MYHLPLTLETPAENLALDEALLEAAVTGELPGEVLRVWEPAEYFVVLGRSSAAAEVRLDACTADGLPVLRRPSGGATVAAGPGCLMYALVLDLDRVAELRHVDRAHQFVLGRMAAALASVVPGVAVFGTSDLAIPASLNGSPPRKFSGNSLRLKRNRLLYHGTILYDFPLEQLERWLDRPARQPEYRQARRHAEFVTNLSVGRDDLTASLVNEWNATEVLTRWPRERTAELAACRYSVLDW